MNCKFWNDVELTETIQKLHRAQNVLDIYHRNGQMGRLAYLLADMEDAARKAQWRILELEGLARKETSCPIVPSGLRESV